jgi:hypothetical protein
MCISFLHKIAGGMHKSHGTSSSSVLIEIEITVESNNYKGKQKNTMD